MKGKCHPQYLNTAIKSCLLLMMLHFGANFDAGVVFACLQVSPGHFCSVVFFCFFFTATA